MIGGIFVSFTNLKNNSRLMILALLASIIVSALIPLMRNKITFLHAKQDIKPVSLWDFSQNDTTLLWQFQKPADSEYQGEDNSSIGQNSGMLVLNVDFSNNKDTNYCQVQIACMDKNKMQLKDCNHASFDFIYDSNQLDGDFLFKLQSNDCDINNLTTLNKSATTDYTDSLKKASISFDFNKIQNENTDDLCIQIIGNKTSYKGELYIDNIGFYKLADNSK